MSSQQVFTPHALLGRLGIAEHPLIVAPDAQNAAVVVTTNPATGAPIAGVRLQSREELNAAVARCERAFAAWRTLPAPQRG